MLRKLLPLLFIACFFMPITVNAEGPAVGASHVWIREAPPGVQVLAGYFTLENFSNRPLAIVSVTSPDFGSVMMQRTLQHNDRDRMEPVTTLSIPPHQSVVFAPGGSHLMLIKPRKRFFDGDLVTLTLTFSDHSSLTIMAPVRRDNPQH
ncbi:MAG: copper chaperone PCu(A)C [Gammaproteobacteria bacterium]